jgi:hypothetical protein
MQEEEEEVDNIYKIFSKTQKQHTQTENMLQRLAGWLATLTTSTSGSGLAALLALLRFALLCFAFACCLLSPTTKQQQQQQQQQLLLLQKTATVAKWVVAKRQQVCIFFLSFSFVFPLSLSLSLSLSRNHCCCWLATIASFFLTR